LPTEAVEPPELGVPRGSIAVTTHDDVSVLTLIGEHDMDSATELREAISALADAGRGIVISVTEAEFIDSTIVRTLFEGDRQLLAKGRRLVLNVGTGSVVERLLVLSGALDHLMWCDSIDEAVLFADPRRSGEPQRGI
jgi:anti-anti-sigma factor